MAFGGARAAATGAGSVSGSPSDQSRSKVRRAAAGALASMNLPVAGDALLGLLESPHADPAARLSAWSGLARLGREEAWSAFEGILASAGGEVTREMVIEAAIVNEDERLREPLERALEDPELAESMEVEAGTVVFHSKDRDEVYRKAIELRPKRFAVFFTGKVPKDTAIVL